MRIRSNGRLLACAALLLLPAVAAAQDPHIMGGMGGDYAGGFGGDFRGGMGGDVPAYGDLRGMYINGLGYSLGYYDIYDSRRFQAGWWWPNVHWPSRDYHFTYGGGHPDTYRVFYPSLLPPRGKSYVTAPLNLPSATPPPQVRMEVHVHHANAQLYIEGRRMQSTGTTRRFISPKLTPNKAYAYEITVRWTENGQKRSATKTVQVKAGEERKVRFED
jgi:uncharacterized protein (TIGR03000 family)